MADLKDLISQVVLPITVTDLKERLETGRVSSDENYVSHYCQRNSNTENENLPSDNKRYHSSGKGCKGAHNKESHKKHDHHHSARTNISHNNSVNFNTDHHHNIIIKSKVQCPGCCKVFFNEVRLPENFLSKSGYESKSCNNLNAEINHSNNSVGKFPIFKMPDRSQIAKTVDKTVIPKNFEMPNVSNVTSNLTGSEGFVCCICDRVFSERNNYANHLKTHVQGDKYKCSFCTRVLADGATLARHLLEHKTNTCSTCKKTFPDKWKYTRHLQTHVDNKCTMCHKRFVKKTSLNSHMISRHKKHPHAIMPSRNECNVCKKVFAEESNLVEHMKIHAPENLQIVPYNNVTTVCVSNNAQSSKVVSNQNDNLCTICGKSYKDKWKLKQHIIIHTEEKSHACHICDKKFHFKWRLTRHIKRCHAAKQGEEVVKDLSMSDIEPKSESKEPSTITANN